MIIIAGEFRVDPAERDAFLATRHAQILQSRGEEGCVEYALSADPLEPDRVLLFECWTGEDELANHIVALPKPSTVTAISSDVRVYDVGGSRPFEGAAAFLENYRANRA